MHLHSSAGHLAGPTDPAGLVLEHLPSGEPAWLRADLDAAIRDSGRLHDDLTHLLGWTSAEPAEVRVPLTQAGRDLLARQRALADLFGPWPTLAEVRP